MVVVQVSLCGPVASISNIEIELSHLAPYGHQFGLRDGRFGVLYFPLPRHHLCPDGYPLLYHGYVLPPQFSGNEAFGLAPPLIPLCILLRYALNQSPQADHLQV